MALQICSEVFVEADTKKEIKDHTVIHIKKSKETGSEVKI